MSGPTVCDHGVPDHRVCLECAATDDEERLCQDFMEKIKLFRANLLNDLVGRTRKELAAEIVAILLAEAAGCEKYGDVWEALTCAADNIQRRYK